jgi:hypothetical protein
MSTQELKSIDLLPTYTTTTVVKHGMSVRYFDELVYVSIVANSIFKQKVEDAFHQGEGTGDKNIGKPRRNARKYGYAMLASQYKEKLAENGDDVSWVAHQPFDNELVAVPEKRLEYYRKGKEHHYRHESRQDKKEMPYQDDLLATLEAGAFDRIVEDKIGEDGFFYDIHGKKVMRGFSFDYISGRLNSGHYKVKALHEFLAKNPEVVDLVTIEIPYYNADEDSGNKAIEFTWMPPTERVFNNALEKDGGGGSNWHVFDYIRNRLKVSRFERKDKEEDD